MSNENYYQPAPPQGYPPMPPEGYQPAPPPGYPQPPFHGYQPGPPQGYQSGPVQGYEAGPNYGYQPGPQQGYAPPSQKYVPPYGYQSAAPQPMAPPVASGPVPPLWIVAGKDEPASGPYRPHQPLGAGAPASAVKPGTIAKILAKAFGRTDVAVRLAVKRRFDISYIIIGIPLWFNIYHDYLLFTDDHIVFSRATLWSGIRADETFAIPFSEIDYIYLTKGSWRKLPHFGIARQGADPLEVRIDKKPANLLAWCFSAQLG